MVLFKVQAFFFKCPSEIKGTRYSGLLLCDHCLWTSIANNGSGYLAYPPLDYQCWWECDKPDHSEPPGDPKPRFWTAGYCNGILKHSVFLSRDVWPAELLKCGWLGRGRGRVGAGGVKGAAQGTLHTLVSRSYPCWNIFMLLKSPFEVKQ